MIFLIKISSKNLKIIKNFLLFFKKISSKNLNIKFCSIKKKKKFVTVLKSPHINKTAQEQFEFRFYEIFFFLNFLKYKKIFYILKKIQTYNFFGFSIKIVGYFKIITPLNKLLLNPDNINFKFFKLINNDIKIKLYLQIFDIYGEQILINKLKNIFSSVG